MVATSMKKAISKKKIIIRQLGILNALLLLLLLGIATSSDVFSIKMAMSLWALNALATLGLFWHFVQTTQGQKQLPDLSDSNHYVDDHQREKLEAIQHHIDQGDFVSALNLISDYAMADYKDLIDDYKLPYVMAVILGRYRKICREECINFEIQLPKTIQFNTDKMNFFVNIVGNLLDNAYDEVRAHKKDRIIIIQFEAESGERIAVRVFNPIRHKDIAVDKIFQPGYSTKKGTQKQDRGYGLSLVEELVCEQKGELHVYVQDMICFEVIL